MGVLFIIKRSAETWFVAFDSLSNHLQKDFTYFYSYSLISMHTMHTRTLWRESQSSALLTQFPHNYWLTDGVVLHPDTI